MEAQWTVVGWLLDWFAPWDGHFWLGALGGLLGYYLTWTILSVGRGRLCSRFSAREVDRYISLCCWLGCTAGGLLSHVMRDWGLRLF